MRILAVRGRNLASLAAFEEMLYREAPGRCFRERNPLSEANLGRKLADLLPRDVLIRRYSRDYEGKPPDDLLEAFGELLDGVAQAESR